MGAILMKILHQIVASGIRAGLVAIRCEDLLDGLFEQICHFECERQARFVFFRFDGIDRLPRYAELGRGPLETNCVPREEREAGSSLIPLPRNHQSDDVENVDERPDVAVVPVFGIQCDHAFELAEDDEQQKRQWISD